MYIIHVEVKANRLTAELEKKLDKYAINYSIVDNGKTLAIVARENIFNSVIYPTLTK